MSTNTKAAHKSGRKSKKINLKRLTVLLVAVIAVVYFGGTLISQQKTLNQKNKEIEALEQKIAEAAAETERLEQEVENLENPEYIEKVAREKLGLIGPNERVFVDANKADETP